MRKVLVNPAHEHDWQEIEPYFREFEDAIPAWIYTVEFVSGGGEFVMQAIVDDARGKLILERGMQWSSNTEAEDRRRITLHEIMHCYTVPQKGYAVSAVEAIGVDQAVFRLVQAGASECMERMNEAMTQVMLRFFNERRARGQSA